MSALGEETRAALWAVSIATVATQPSKRGFQNVFARGPAPLDPANAAISPSRP